MSISRQNFELALQPGGEIDSPYQRQIRAVKSMNAARQLSTKLHEDVVAAAINRWLGVCEFTQKECVTLMTPFFDEAIALPQTTSQPRIQIHSELSIEEEWQSKLLTGGREMIALNALASLPLTVLIGASALTGPLGVFTLTATGLWGFVHGWTSSGRTQLNDARTRLSQHLNSLLQEVRHYFFATELRADSLSVVDQYFEGLRRFTVERIEGLATQKSSEAQAEVARLVEQATLDDTQRQMKVQQIQQHLAAWDMINTVLNQIRADLEAV